MTLRDSPLIYIGFGAKHQKFFHTVATKSEFRTDFTKFFIHVVLFLYILRYKELDNAAAFTLKTKIETFDMEAEKCNQ